MYTAEFIQNLLEKYWEGESSLEEERLLKAYFNSPDPDPRFEAEAALFRTIRAEQALELQPVRIKPIQDRRWQWAAAAVMLLTLSAGMWWWSAPGVPDKMPVASLEIPAPIQGMPEQEKTPQERLAPEQKVLVAKVAPRQKTKKHRKQTVSLTATEKAEAEAAMVEIKSALRLLSGKINHGRKEAVKGLQEVNHIDILKKNPTDS